MSTLRLMVLALTGLMALPLTGSAPQQPNYVDLNKSRLIIVKGRYLPHGLRSGHSC